MARTITYTVSLGARGPAGPPGDGSGTTLTSYATQIATLGDYPATFPADHAAVTVTGNGLSLTGQQISLSIGTGSTQVAAGNHTHTWSAVAPPGGSATELTDTISMPVWSGGTPGFSVLSSIFAWIRTKFAAAPVSIAEGGTGGTDAGTARTNLKVPASDPTGVSGADAVSNIITLTQAEYDAIGTPDASTLYVIV